MFLIRGKRTAMVECVHGKLHQQPISHGFIGERLTSPFMRIGAKSDAVSEQNQQCGLVAFCGEVREDRSQDWTELSTSERPSVRRFPPGIPSAVGAVDGSSGDSFASFERTNVSVRCGYLGVVDRFAVRPTDVDDLERPLAIEKACEPCSVCIYHAHTIPIRELAALNPEYAELAAGRLSQLSLLAEV
jgi:hypothetical protein